MAGLCCGIDPELSLPRFIICLLPFSEAQIVLLKPLALVQLTPTTHPPTQAPGAACFLSTTRQTRRRRGLPAKRKARSVVVHSKG